MYQFQYFNVLTILCWKCVYITIHDVYTSNYQTHLSVTVLEKLKPTSLVIIYKTVAYTTFYLIT